MGTPLRPDFVHRVRRQAATMHMLLQREIGNLIDNQPYTTFGDDVGHTITYLDPHYCACWVDAKHRKQVHNRVRAPTNARHDLRSTDLSCDDRILFTFGCGRESNEELVNDVQEK